MILWKSSLPYTLETWFLSGGPAILIAVMVWLNVSKRQDCLRDMENTLRTREDLEKLKNTINYNMKTAIIFIILFAVSMIVIIFYNKSQFPFNPYRAFITGNHFILLGIFSLIASQFSRVSEKKLKNLMVDSTDPLIGDTYRRWLKEWKQIRLQLSEVEEPGQE
jgi:hypothetical protein